MHGIKSLLLEKRGNRYHSHESPIEAKALQAVMFGLISPDDGETLRRRVEELTVHMKETKRVF